MRLYLAPILAFTIVAGCASAGTTSSAVSSKSGKSTSNVPGSRGIRVNDDNGMMVSDLAIAPNKVWWSLPEAFDSLGVPLTLVDHPKKTLANEGFKVRGKLGQARLSTYFECGTTQVGPNADSYEMFISMMTQLDSLGAESTRLTTTVSAAAKPLQFAQDYSRCTSKGTLEKELLAVVKAKLAAGRD